MNGFVTVFSPLPYHFLTLWQQKTAGIVDEHGELTGKYQQKMYSAKAKRQPKKTRVLGYSTLATVHEDMDKLLLPSWVPVTLDSGRGKRRLFGRRVTRFL